MPRQTLRLSLLTCALAACLPALAADLAHIVSMTGSGDWRPDSDPAWRVAKVKLGLPAESHVRTGDLASMSLLFADGAQVKLAQNAIFQLKAVPKEGTVLDLKRGRAWSQAKETRGQLRMQTPSALAAISGTDWEMQVDDDGRSTLTVLHGRVEFSNAFGRVSVGGGEAAVAAVGQAPVKIQLQRPAERIQWVNYRQIDLAAYPETRFKDTHAETLTLQAVATHLQAGRMAEAATALEALPADARRSAVPGLLRAELAALAGDIKASQRWLDEASARFPNEGRVPAVQARLLLAADQPAEARKLVAAAVQRFPAEPELMLVSGDLARLDGREAAARAAYSAFLAGRPDDPRGRRGLAAMEVEREDLPAARQQLMAALAGGDSPGLRGELGNVEALRSDWQQAHTQFDAALAAQPDDYVALTGRGVARLKQGQNAAAQTDLLAATLVEPLYARAYAYLAVAYYRQGKQKAALDTLARAKELDPNDPLPYQLAALIEQDRMAPSAAIDEAQGAMQRLPFLKSLNPLGVDQQGSANLGSGFAAFGLESWAMSYAQRSYDPLWAGSEFFLANRYRGEYLKNSSLLRAYLADPLTFGAPNDLSPLVGTPGSHLSLTGNVTLGRQFRAYGTSVSAYGMSNASMPLAWFTNAEYLKVDPKQLPLDGHLANYTLALGMQPTYELRAFLFANRTDGDMIVPDPQGDIGPSRSVVDRLDAGINWRHSPTAQTWFKLGWGRWDDDSQRSVGIFNRSAQQAPTQQDVQWRHVMRLGGHELMFGSEHERADQTRESVSIGTVPLAGGKVFTTRNLETRDFDRRNSLYYMSDRLRLSGLEVDGALAYSSIDARRENSNRTFQNDKLVATFHKRWDVDDDGWLPSVGAVAAFGQDSRLRLAGQTWRRGWGPATLAPISNGGIPVDDEVVLPGGRLERFRLQWESDYGRFAFAKFFADYKEVKNLLFSADEPAEGQTATTAAFDILQRRKIPGLGNVEYLESPISIGAGRIWTSGATADVVLSPNLSAYIGYVRSKGVNTSGIFKDFEVPNLPRHRFALGSTWLPGQRFKLETQMTYLTRRYTSEANLTESYKPSGWTGNVVLSWSSPDKRLGVSAFTTGLFRKDDNQFFAVRLDWHPF